MSEKEIIIRELARADMQIVIRMLKENMSAFAPDEAQYDAIWQEYTAQKNMHGVVATIDAVVVGYGSILIETKLRGGRVGHMEDIVCDAPYRRQRVGSKIMRHLRKIASEMNCYKVSLTCAPHNTVFYEKNEYQTSGLCMAQHLKS